MATAHITYDKVTRDNATEECIVGETIRDMSHLQITGVLTKRVKKSVFLEDLKRIYKYTKAMFELEAKFATVSCKPSGKGNRSIQMLSFKDVRVEASYSKKGANKNKMIHPGFTIEGRFRLSDLRALKKMLQIEHAKLNTSYGKGLKTEVDREYLFGISEKLDGFPLRYTKYRQEANLYEYCAYSLTNVNRILYATNAFRTYLDNELAGGNPVVEKLTAEGLKELATAATRTFEGRFFTRKLLFYFFYSFLKKQGTNKKKGIALKYAPTKAMKDAGLFKGLDFVSAIDITKLFRNTKFFLSAPVVTARYSNDYINGKCRQHSDRVIAYVKDVRSVAERGEGATNKHLGELFGADEEALKGLMDYVPSDNLSISNDRSIKATGYVRRFNYEVIGDVFASTAGVIQLHVEDVKTSQSDKKRAKLAKALGQ